MIYDDLEGQEKAWESIRRGTRTIVISILYCILYEQRFRGLVHILNKVVDIY